MLVIIKLDLHEELVMLDVLDEWDLRKEESDVDVHELDSYWLRLRMC